MDSESLSPTSLPPRPNTSGISSGFGHLQRATRRTRARAIRSGPDRCACLSVRVAPCPKVQQWQAGRDGLADDSLRRPSAPVPRAIREKPRYAPYRQAAQSTGAGQEAFATIAEIARLLDAIRRMALPHGSTITATDRFTWSAAHADDSARVTVTALNTTDARMAAGIRALGFVGLLTLGNHHTAHHAMANLRRSKARK